MNIKSYDDELYEALEKEKIRQEEHIELIASENYTSPRIIEAQGSRLDLGGARGRLISQEDKQTVLKLILEACKSGARKSKAAQLLGLTIRTLQRWSQNGLSDNRKGSRAAPGNKLSDDEKARITNVLESPEFAESNPNQIVPRLADQGILYPA